MKINMSLIYFFLFINLIIFSYTKSEKLYCEEIIAESPFNENEIIKKMDRNMDILKNQLGYKNIDKSVV